MLRTKRGNLASFCLAALVVLHASAAAQTVVGPRAAPAPKTVVTQSGAAARAALVLDETSELVIDAEGRAHVGGRLAQRDEWLRGDLMTRFPGLAGVDFLDEISSRATVEGTSAARRRYLEIHGPAELVERARIFSRDLIDAQRGGVVELEMHVIRSPIDRVLGQQPEPHVETLDETQLRKALAQHAGDRCETLAVPRITVLLGQDALIAVKDQVSYIKDYDVEQTSAGSVIADPIIDTIADGLEIEACALRLPAAAGTALSLRFKMSRLMRPIEKMQIQLAGASVEIELPELRYFKWAASFTLDPTHAGFLVRGLCAPALGKQGSWEQEDVVLIGRLKLATQESVLTSAQVLGFDPAERMAFIAPGSPGDLRSGAPVSFWRGEAKIGAGMVTEHASGTLVVRVTDGEPRAGDTVR
jgi:hypothetical protein